MSMEDRLKGWDAAKQRNGGFLYLTSQGFLQYLLVQRPDDIPYAVRLIPSSHLAFIICHWDSDSLDRAFRHPSVLARCQSGWFFGVNADRVKEAVQRALAGAPDIYLRLKPAVRTTLSAALPDAHVFDLVAQNNPDAQRLAAIYKESGMTGVIDFVISEPIELWVNMNLELQTMILRGATRGQLGHLIDKGSGFLRWLTSDQATAIMSLRVALQTRVKQPDGVKVWAWLHDGVRKSLVEILPAKGGKTVTRPEYAELDRRMAIEGDPFRYAEWNVACNPPSHTWRALLKTCDTPGQRADFLDVVPVRALAHLATCLSDDELEECLIDPAFVTLAKPSWCSTPSRFTLFLQEYNASYELNEAMEAFLFTEHLPEVLAHIFDDLDGEIRPTSWGQLVAVLPKITNCPPVVFRNLLLRCSDDEFRQLCRSGIDVFSKIPYGLSPAKLAIAAKELDVINPDTFMARPALERQAILRRLDRVWLLTLRKGLNPTERRQYVDELLDPRRQAEVSRLERDALVRQVSKLCAEGVLTPAEIFTKRVIWEMAEYPDVRLDQLLLHYINTHRGQNVQMDGPVRDRIFKQMLMRPEMYRSLGETTQNRVRAQGERLFGPLWPSLSRRLSGRDE